MGVFDGSVKVKRAVSDPGTDKKLPSMGSLSYGAIKSATALAGTTGVDACLIQGNKWQELKGQHTENVLQHHLLTIQGNRQEMVVGNHTHTIVGNTNNTHVGTHNHTNISPRNDTFVHTRTENHSEEEHQNQPIGRNESTSSEHTNTEDEQHFKGTEYTMTMLKLEATVTNLEHKTLSVGVHGINSEAKIMHHTSEALENKLQGFVSEVVPAKLKAAGAHIKAVGASLNAGVAANSDSPFA
jgi:hypothetical protein